MARLLPFYRTGGLLSGGGGGGPLGDATVWPAVLDWAALGTIAGPLRVGDRVEVSDLQPGLAYAARYSGGGGWELAQAVFPTVADLLDFNEPIFTSATAIVGTGVETDPVYYYDGSQWLRMPDDVHYIWTDRIDWADLAMIADPQIDDEALVGTLGTTASSAKAQRHLNQWRLIEGNWATVADMTAWPQVGQAVHNLAFARVKAAGGSASDAVPYVYQGGNWVRYAGLTAGFAWTLSSLDDFSAIGLKDGDFGVFTPSGGGPILVRYVAACAYRSGTGTGTRQIWVHPDIYGRTNLQIEAYVVGTETAPAYGSALQGYTYDRTGVGTISSVSGYMRLDTPVPGSGSQFAFMTSPAISGAKRFYVRTELRGVTAGSTGEAGLFNLSSIPQTQWTIASRRAASSGLVFPTYWDGAAWQSALASVAVRSSGLALPASTPWIVEGLSSGGAITDMMETRIDGLSYCSLRRNFDAATGSTNFNVFPLVTANVSGSSSGQLDIRNHYVLSSD